MRISSGIFKNILKHQNENYRNKVFNNLSDSDINFALKQLDKNNGVILDVVIDFCDLEVEFFNFTDFYNGRLFTINDDKNMHIFKSNVASEIFLSNEIIKAVIKKTGEKEGCFSLEQCAKIDKVFQSGTWEDFSPRNLEFCYPNNIDVLDFPKVLDRDICLNFFVDPLFENAEGDRVLQSKINDYVSRNRILTNVFNSKNQLISAYNSASEVIQPMHDFDCYTGIDYRKETNM